LAAETLNLPSIETSEESSLPVPRYQRFAQELVVRGKLREPEIIRAQKLGAQTDEPRIPALLLKLGLLSERDTAEILSDVSGLPLVVPDDYPESSPLPDTISIRFLKENHLVGLAANDDQVTVAVTDPFDQELLDSIALACDKPVIARVGLGTEIDRALETQLGPGKSLMGEITDTFGSDDDINEADVEHLKDLASEAPVIRMVNLIMQRAVEMRASDIHVEPFEEILKVRLRVDGVLREIESPPVRSTAAPAAGWPHQAPGSGQGAGSSRLDRADHVRRERRYSFIAQGKHQVRL